MTADNPIAHKGVVLKQARESRGIRLETVHEATKIPMDALRAIEEGYTVRTLSTFYYKGFIKMYSQYLGIHIQDDIADRPKEMKRPPSPLGSFPMSPLKKVRFKYEASNNLPAFLSNEKVQQVIVIAGVLLALFIFFKIVSAVGHWMTARPKRPPVEQRANASRVTPLTQMKPRANQEKKKILIKPVVKKFESKAAAVPPAPAVESQPQPKPQTKTESPAEAKASMTAAPASVEQTTVSLTVRAKKNSWLQVKVDGVVVFQSPLNRGAVESWIAQEKIELSGKILMN